MSNLNDFIIWNGVLKEYVGAGGDVVIPDGVTDIENGAFENCRNIENITIPQSVNKIGAHAFRGCKNIKEIEVTGNVKSIYCATFNFCEKLERITLPQSVEEISWGTFEECDSLDWIFAPNVQFGDLKDQGAGLAAARAYLEKYQEYKDPEISADYNKYISSQKKKLIPYIFANDMISAVTLYAKLGKITKSNVDADFLNPAISYNATQCISYILDWKNKNVSAEYEGKKIERELNKDPFNAADMKKVWSYIQIPDGTIGITGYKGDDCDVEIPDHIGNKKVSTICKYAFSGEPQKSLRARGVKKSEKECRSAERLTNIAIPEGVEKIERCAFEKCKKLKGVILPESLIEIGDYAFLDCINLKSINFPNNITLIDTAAFKGCKELVDNEGMLIVKDTILYIDEEKEFKIPDGVTQIGAGAFFGNKTLKTLDVPHIIKEIKTCAFAFCKNLRKVTLEENVANIEEKAFFFCKKLKDIIIRGKTTQIKKNAFEDCPNLTIHAPSGSFAEEYAKENGIPFIAE